MRRTSHPVGRLFLSVVLISLLVALTGVIVLAQDGAQPRLAITGMDFADLPNVHVTVSGSNLGAPLAELPTVLKEDGVEQPILESKAVDIGVATAFLIDASDNIRDPGNTGEPRYTEIANAVQRFIEMGLLAAETDWMAAYTIQPEGDGFIPLADWNQDHQAVANALRSYAPEQLPESTPLFNLIKYGLDQVQIAPFPDNLRQSLVVFSDGFDELSAVEIDDLINRAARMGVTIHTVMIGPESEPRRQNLQRISDLSGGQYVLYNEIGDMEGLWRQLAQERGQQMYTYRLTKHDPELLEIAVTAPSGRTFSDEMPFTFIPLQPAQIEVVLPAADTPVIRTGAAPDTPQAELEPAALPIELAVTWPDNHPRNFDHIEYEIGGRTVMQATEPFTTFAFPLGDLGAGAQTLRVYAYDELDIASRPALRSFAIELVWPTPEPTATPEPAPPATEAPLTDTTAGGLPAGDDAGGGDTGGDAGGSDSPGGAGGTGATGATGATATPRVVPVDLWTPAFGTTLGSAPFAYEVNTRGDRRLVLGSVIVPITPLTIGLAAAPFLLLIGALVLVGRRRKPTEMAFTTAGAYDQSTVADNKSTMIEATAYELTEDATEAQPIVDFESPASLLYVEGGEHLPQKLNIEGGREIRIGRKAAYCDVIIDDQRVSRLHASIHEREDGNFYLKDEGSSGGTFVNRRKLRVNDAHPLNHGDVINFNTVAYRFELADGGAAKGASAQGGSATGSLATDSSTTGSPAGPAAT